MSCFTILKASENIVLYLTNIKYHRFPLKNLYLCQNFCPQLKEFSS